MENKKILEALQMQPLSEEDKTSRHILGRLYGPIATSKESTRNGRKYNAELWDKALKDDVFKEKVANKSLFLELGHPADREETDMTKVCACIPEMPKVIDGDLYAYVDILDTKNGRLLKTLCDYGFVPGISSRGSGDIMPNDEVDPETFFLETWDIVQLPAVKKARLSICESYEGKTLKQVLNESLNNASEEDRKEMTETLVNLGINPTEEEKEKGEKIEEAKEAKQFTDTGVEIVNDPDELTECDKVLTEDTDVEEESEEEAKSEETSKDEAEEVKVAEENAEVSEEETRETENVEDVEEQKPVTLVKDLLDELKDFDENTEVEFTPIVIEDKEYPVEELTVTEDDGKVKLTIGYSQEIGDNIETADSEEAAETVETTDEEIPAEEETPEEKTTDSEEVSDTEVDDEVLESLKEMIRQKDELESKVKSLNSEKTVSDAKVTELNEELLKYKGAFKTVGGIREDVARLNEKVKSLNEELIIKDNQIKELKTAHVSSLNEGLEKSKSEVKTLQENLVSKQQEVEDIKTEMSDEINTYKGKLNESVKIAKYYQDRSNKLLEAYISFRAQMLGVKSTDIKNRLDEKYEIEDIDKVCDQLISNNIGFQFNLGSTKKVRINESKNSVSEDDDLKELYELAGLK
jgi:hypothetical protein